MPYSVTPLMQLMGGLGAGFQGYEQGRMGEADVQSKLIANEQAEQQMSAAPLLFIQQRLKAHPEMIHDAQTITQLNKFGKPFGIYADPQQGIDPAFMNYDLLQVVNPMQAARISAELDNKFQTSILGALKAPGDPLTNLKMVIASAPPGVDKAGAIAMLSDPTVQAQLAQDYSLKVSDIDSRILKNQSGATLNTQRANEIGQLMPLRAQEMVANIGLRRAQTEGQYNLMDYRTNRNYLGFQTLAETIKRDANTYDARLKAIQAVKDSSAERKRHDLATELAAKSNQYRQMIGTLWAEAQSEQQNGTVSPEAFGSIMQLLQGTDDQSGQHTPGALDMLDAFDQGVNAINALPSVQPPGLPHGTQATPRGIKYDTGRKLLIVAGPNKGKGVYQGYLYDPVKGKLGPYQSNSQDVYQPASP